MSTNEIPIRGMIHLIAKKKGKKSFVRSLVTILILNHPVQSLWWSDNEVLRANQITTEVICLQAAIKHLSKS